MLEKSNNVDYVNKVKPMFIVELSCVDYGDKVNILTLFNESTICSLEWLYYVNYIDYVEGVGLSS